MSHPRKARRTLRYTGFVSASVPNVPPHLRRFVVEQDYDQYTAVDQAVWRFVLLQTYSRLVQTAHPAYRNGLGSVGITVDHIPRIAEMNERLAPFGWGAVCVDGFIPPRAFQEFQASGVLPVAADVRTREHLVYTPAPDIIHEAAGHAPILPDPAFSAYIRRIGELGKKAFTLPEESRVYRAFYTLSEVKETPGVDMAQVAAAESELSEALAGAVEPSEATLLSRLYWWTAEYGLVGRTDDYKIYGAGLLSSLGESHSCHDPSVTKRPLDEHCIEQAYDITRPQPQLFVVADFEQLHDVLDRVAAGLAARIGGAVALTRALASAEVASIRFSSGAWAIGVLRAVGPQPADPAWLDFTGPVAFAWDGTIRAEQAHLANQDEALILTGKLEGGQPLELADALALSRLIERPSGRHRFRFETGALVEGHIDHAVRAGDGRLMHLELSHARVALPGLAPRDLARFVLLSAGDVVAAHAGSVDSRYYPDTPFSSARVPKPRVLPAAERALLKLYERAERAHREGAPSMHLVFPRILAALDSAYSDEWLLRWNLLESLLKQNATGPLSRTLNDQLERLEDRFEHREPIASGLRYLSASAA
jgi:phenylalanine-4-hydroxylase